MASKKDYDAVIDRKAKRGRVVETVAASINANPKQRAKALEIARDPAVNRQRAGLAFDRSAKAKAKGK